MCGRFTLTTDDIEQLEARFSFHTDHLSFAPRYNIAPSQPVLTVIGDEKGNRGGWLRWGLIPAWAKDAAIGNRMINARAETVAEKPSFRRALQQRRCLILADGFYEWRQEGKKKTPIFITLTSRAPFAFAGLWETWRPPNGEALHSCTIITTPPNALMESIHNRMPVILAREAETLWLDRTITEPETLLPLLTPYAETPMEAYAVALTVNSPKNDSPACIAPVQ